MDKMLYLRRNKKIMILFTSIITLSILTIITIVTLESSVHNASREMVLSPLERFSIARWQNPNEEPSIDALRTIGGGEHQIFEVSLWHVGLSTMLGSMLSFAVLPDNSDDLYEIFNQSGLVMLDGNMPRDGYSEIIVHEQILINRDLSIGEVFFAGLTVSGYFTGDVTTSLGLSNASTSSNDFLIIPTHGGVDLLNSELDLLHGDDWSVFSYSRSLATLEDDFSKMITMLFINMSLVSTSVAIALGALVYTMYQGRMSEFAILSALGETKQKIGQIILKETVSIVTLSWVLGYLLSLVMLFVLDIAFFRRLGQYILFFSLEALLLSVAISIFIIMCAVIPARIKLWKSDLIVIIERG